MKDLTVDDLRALIRLIGPVRALREDTEKSLMLETYSGTGRLTVRTFRSLRDQVAQITRRSRRTAAWQAWTWTPTRKARTSTSSRR
jgi:hypothetical protein